MQSHSGDLSSRDLIDSLSTLNPVLERHAAERFGSSVMTAAWLNFSRWGTAAIAHEKQAYVSAFTAWWLFAWLPDDEELKNEKFLAPAPDYAIAADYLKLHRNKLKLLEQRVIERAVKSPYSFYTVLSIEQDNRLRLQEIYTQKQMIVQAGSNTIHRAGDILFTAVLIVEGVSVLLGCMPIALEASSLARIEAHREKWCRELGHSIDQRLLYLHDTELRRFFYVLLNQKQQVNLH